VAAVTPPVEIRVPGDKSLSHRALILSALADGPSRITGLLLGADVHSTAGVLRALGVAIPSLGNDVTVPGVGLRGLRAPVAELDCGNSGTTTRLMAGVLAAQPFRSVFIGDKSLSKRPMKRIARPLQAMGASVTLGGKREDGLPMTIEGGTLRSIEWRSDTASAQVKSAILLAGLCAGVPVSVQEPVLSRDHSERMLAARGATLSRRGTAVSMPPVASLRALDTAIPGDPSSAAFFLALAALGAGPVRLPDVCLNRTRTGFLETLRAMGATAFTEEERLEGGEPVGTMRAEPSALRGVTVRGDIIPTMIDELPLLACLAARADGDTVIREAEELRGKESDRIAAVVANLRAIGVDAEELPDGMRITGSQAPLRGTVVTHGDHRLAMAFGVLGAASGGDIVVDDPECVAVSYPGFWADLARATG
jgi:3-phosphoshikimate 1-carboxyvinyltransferase